ncbi:hypothetical protein, partial [Nocardia sp. MW-W600-9]
QNCVTVTGIPGLRAAAASGQPFGAAAYRRGLEQLRVSVCGGESHRGAPQGMASVRAATSTIV